MPDHQTFSDLLNAHEWEWMRQTRTQWTVINSRTHAVRRLTPSQAIRRDRQRQAVNKRVVTRMITNYTKLGDKIDGRCRYIEAKRLLEATKKGGDPDQRAKVMTLLNGKFHVSLSCECTDGSCDATHYENPDGDHWCDCITRNFINCHGLYVFVSLPNGTNIGVN